MIDQSWKITFLTLCITKPGLVAQGKEVLLLVSSPSTGDGGELVGFRILKSSWDCLLLESSAQLCSVCSAEAGQAQSCISCVLLASPPSGVPCLK